MNLNFNNILAIEHNGKTVVDIFINNNKVWQAASPTAEPFYVENITNANETLSIAKDNDSAPTLTIEYSTDKSTWQTLGTTSTTTLTRTVVPGEKVYLRCSTGSWGAYDSSSYSNKYNRIQGVSKVGGNTMSLLYGSNFTGQETSFPSRSDHNFGELFYNNTRLVDASGLLLPATTLADSCYYRMFKGCTSLTAAPALPATTLARSCYDRMFEGCASLTSAPTLPATTLADYCYEWMFSTCTSLTSAPALPATTLASNCYSSMFYYCTALTAAPALPVTTLAGSCYSGMFQGCTSLTSAPELPATTLIGNCYRNMFNGCTSLNKVTCLATTNINTNDSTYRWLYNVASTGTFNKASGATWPTDSANGIPTGWTAVSPFEPFYVENININSEGDGTGEGDGEGEGEGDEPEVPEFETVEFTSIGENAPGIDVEWSADGSTWYPLESTQPDPEDESGFERWILEVYPGQKVYLRCGDAMDAWATDESNYISITGMSKVGGNIMSLLYGSNFTGQETEFPSGSSYNFCNLFYGSEIVDASELVLPATTLTDHCYRHMFAQCNLLTSAPALPATTLAQNCYSNMFEGCGALTSAPALPATTLAQECYGAMFFECSSLTSAPALPATTLTDGCYNNMFNGCSSLTSAPALPATIMADNCYSSMFQGCYSLTQAPALPATTLAQKCYSYMFRSNALTSAPALPATTLAGRCYMGMFEYCSSLTQAPELPATTLVDRCYQIMFRYCSSLNKVTCLATSGINENRSTDAWLSGVSPSGVFTKAAGVTWSEGVSGIPASWVTNEV